MELEKDQKDNTRKERKREDFEVGQIYLFLWDGSLRKITAIQKETVSYIKLEDGSSNTAVFNFFGRHDILLKGILEELI